MPPKQISGQISVDNRSEISEGANMDKHTPGRSLFQRRQPINSQRRTGPQSNQMPSPGRETQHETQAFIFGTDISESNIEQKFEVFLKEYKVDGQFHYLQQLHQLIETDQFILNIDGRHLYDFNQKLYKQLIGYPPEVIPIFDAVAQRVYLEMVLNTLANEQQREEARENSQSLIVGIINLLATQQVRELNPKDINRLVAVQGIVIRCSELYPEMKMATFKCCKCGHQVTTPIERGKVEEPNYCHHCKDKNTYEIIHNLCQFTDKQYIKLQEQPENIPEGYTPQTVSLMPYDDNVDVVKPGDRITVIGVYRANALRQMKNRRTLKSVYNTFVDVISYQKDDKIDQNKQTNMTEEYKTQLRQLSTDPNIYDRLVKSLAPSIWGMEDVKMGVLCQLFGGTKKEFSQTGKGRFRADINILLVGDPSTSKSQILKCVNSLSNRGLYTSGKGSSAVGLTVFVGRDQETGEIVLESGALVLSDMGICCIDEFDKMDENAKTILHEAMEQQTISVAKAGIVSQLNARTAILAAANPIKSRYDTKQSVVQNINMPPTILSRFDLIYLVLEEQNSRKDELLAYHILNLYSKQNSKTQYQDMIVEEGDPFLLDRETLFNYIQYARDNIYPKLSQPAQIQLIESYTEMRRGAGNKNIVSATPRQLESLIRLSEALAKMQYSELVTAEHVIEGYKLIEDAMKKAAMDPVTGLIDMDLLTTGRSHGSRELVQKFLDTIPKIISANPLDFRQSGMRFFDFVDRLIQQLHGEIDEDQRKEKLKLYQKEIAEALYLLEENQIVVLQGDRNLPRIRAGSKA